MKLTIFCRTFVLKFVFSINRRFQLLNLNGVRSFSNFHVWQLKSDNNVASACLQIEDTANEQVVRQSAKQIFKKFGILQATIQIEKKEFEVHLNALYPGYRHSVQINRSSFVPKINHSHSHSNDNDGHAHSSHGHSHDGHSSHGHSHDGHGHSHNHQTIIGINGTLNSGRH